MQITVLCGGPSAEREISLISGKSVAQGLRDAGHEVFVADVSPDDLSALDHPADVVFPVLHGEFGEDGQIQAILESRDIPFVGSGSEASRIGMDKIATKQVWRDAGLPTPAWETVSAVGATPASPAPCVVKAIASGSSIDVHLCKTQADATNAINTLVQKHGRCMVEQFIKGPELTVGLLDGQALPPIRIETTSTFFDFKAKYTKGGAKHNFDLGLPDALVKQCQHLAERANAVLGCRDLARVDIMIDEATQSPYLLEINTIPGFTPVSLLPEAAAKTGIPFPELVDRLAKMALSRHATV
jgi:D-alanine-D-alanine ligase